VSPIPVGDKGALHGIPTAESVTVGGIDSSALSFCKTRGVPALAGGANALGLPAQKWTT